jgi:hypothetical protein
MKIKTKRKEKIREIFRVKSKTLIFEFERENIESKNQKRKSKEKLAG